MNLGLAIKRIRTEKGISQGSLAEQCEISQTSLSQIEKGVKRPNPKTLKNICESLEVPETIIYLYGMEESDVPEEKKELYNHLYPTVESMIKRLLIAES